MKNTKILITLAVAIVSCLLAKIEITAGTFDKLGETKKFVLTGLSSSNPNDFNGDNLINILDELWLKRELMITPNETTTTEENETTLPEENETTLPEEPTTTEGATTIKAEETTTVEEETTTVEETTTEDPWDPPIEEGLIDPWGNQIFHDQYQGILDSAELFGIKRFRITWVNEWEDVPPYALWRFTHMSRSLIGEYNRGYYMWQIFLPDDYNSFDPNPLESSDTKVLGWRPTLPGEKTMMLYGDGIYIFALHKRLKDFEGDWVLIPLDKDGNDDLKLLLPE